MKLGLSTFLVLTTLVVASFAHYYYYYDQQGNILACYYDRYGRWRCQRVDGRRWSQNGNRNSQDNRRDNSCGYDGCQEENDDPYPIEIKEHFPDDLKALERYTPLGHALKLIHPQDLKSILVEAPIKESLCDLDPAYLYHILKGLSPLTLKSDNPEDLRQRFCADPYFKNRMAGWPEKALKTMINSIPDVDQLLLRLNETFRIKIIKAANKMLLSQKPKSFLDSYTTAYRIFEKMPEVEAEDASKLIDVNCGCLRYILEAHKDIEQLLPYMEPKSLNHAIECYPELGEKIAKFDKTALELTLQDVYHLVPFLKRLSEKTRKIYLMKVPRLQPLMPKSEEEKKVFHEKIQAKISEKKFPLSAWSMNYLNSKIPEVKYLLGVMNDADLRYAAFNMILVRQALDPMNEDELERINELMEPSARQYELTGPKDIVEVVNYFKNDPAKVFFNAWFKRR